jgi:hypothetical protein
MTDRTSIITGTQAARAFPRLATFLAESTNIAPDVAENALRIACQDYAAAEDAINTRAGWSRAVAMANGTRFGQTDAEAKTDEKPLLSWAAAVAATNGHIGAM